MMHIALVQPVMSPYWERRLIALNSLTDVRISVIVERRGAVIRPGWTPREIPGAEVITLSSEIAGRPTGKRALKYGRVISWNLIFALRKIAPDIILVCNATQLIIAYAAKIIGMKSKIVIMVEDISVFINRIGLIRRAAKAFIYRLADAATYFSLSSESYLDQIGFQKRREYVPWSIPDAKQDAVYDRGSRPVLRFIFVGQLIERKGIDLLVQAWCDVYAKLNTACELIVCGDGPLRSSLQEACRIRGVGTISFKGHLPHDEVQALLRSSDIFIMPTREDLYCVSIMEAMASGLPVITTMNAGAAELIDARTGWIIGEVSEDSIRHTIVDVCEKRNRLSEMGRNALERVEHLTDSAVMKKLFNFCLSLKNQNSRV